MKSISTHVLDVARGRPAPGVPIMLEVRDQGGFRRLAAGTTDDDGRVRAFLPDGALAVGVYRLTFDTATYFRTAGAQGFYPEVSIVFEVREANTHHHVPLLLSPYGYSTYRGS